MGARMCCRSTNTKWLHRPSSIDPGETRHIRSVWLQGHWSAITACHVFEYPTWPRPLPSTDQATRVPRPQFPLPPSGDPQGAATKTPRRCCLRRRGDLPKCEGAGGRQGGGPLVHRVRTRLDREFCDTWQRNNGRWANRCVALVRPVGVVDVN